MYRLGMSTDYPSDQETTDDSSLCTESTTSTMESFSEVQGQLTNLTGLMELLMNQTNAMEAHMKTMERPLHGLALDQLGDIPHLAASPFRKQLFKYKRALPGIDTSHRYSFATICGHFRDYIFANKLVDTEGLITADATLATVFEIQVGAQMNYIGMMRYLRAALH